MSCPSCAQSMTALAEHDVVLDACVHCGSVWLDEGEAEAFSSTS